MNIFIGEQQSEYINIEIEGKLYPDAKDYYDGNYLKTSIKVVIPAFEAHFLTNIRTFELNSFLTGLTDINKSKDSECLLVNVDENIRIIGKTNYTGSIDWSCTLIYPSGNGTMLKFNINTSSSIVDILKLSIKNILDEWPIIAE